MKRHPAWPFALLVLACLAGLSASAAIPAFLGAEGAGAFAVGGRGGRVHYVTNLDDSGPGSLRAACEAAGPRIVLFKVAGTIALKKDIRIREPFITIAGQTAPGGGICLKNFPLLIYTHEVVVRHLRVRPGDTSGKECDGMAIGAGGRQVILDHCSVSWATDETLSISGTNIHNVTVQWCLIAESLNQSVHRKGAHGYGSLIRADGDLTYHHNIYAHHSSRNPRPGSYGQGRGILLDFRNNLIYDWGGRAGYSSQDPATLNYIGNYLKAGPSSRRLNEAFNIGGAATRMYVAGNFYEGGGDLNDNDWKLIGNAKPENQAAQPFPTAPVRTDSASEAFQKLLARAGATAPARDAADLRVIQTIRAGSGKIIDSQTEVGGWPELKSAPPPPDADGDGLPDDWELKHGLNPKNPADANQVTDGYTLLEQYLNNLAAN